MGPGTGPLVKELAAALIRGSIDFGSPFAAPVSHEFGARVTAPGIDLSVRPPAHIAVDGTRFAVASGEPRFAENSGKQSDATKWLALWRERGAEAPAAVKGAYSVVLVDVAKRTALLAIDRFGQHTLCYTFDGKELNFSDRADRVIPPASQTIDPQSVYAYLYFHVIPAPRTVFKNVKRLCPGHSLLIDGANAKIAHHWKPEFKESPTAPMDELSAEFKRLLRESVERDASSGRVGSFLSGGTDSSTIAGLLCQITGRRAPTFSIGFDADGYDEMAYARIAATHFRTEHHEYYVTPADLVASIGPVAAQYDQPFGNSSVIPAYYCAKIARAAGVDVLLAGDGGDELFGGNSRYAKQLVFGFYDRTPRWVRSTVIEPLLLGVPALDRIPVIKKAASYVRQARIPMPDRLETYNLLDRFGIAEVLEGDFLKSVDVHEPIDCQRATYAATGDASLVNRMLAYDWKFTLADTDLPKVVGATGLAGVLPRFPMLADELVDFSLSLPSHLKVRPTKLRYFFKKALRGFLPDEIIAKKKHGFGLPFGMWLVRDATLRAFAVESLTRLREHGIVRPAFMHDILEHRLKEHPAYYGEMVWILMMLSEWFKAMPVTLSAQAEAFQE